MRTVSDRRPLLSIVVTTFQDADNLRLTLASIAQQVDVDLPSIEVIISDGGSTDGTAAVLDTYRSLVTHVRSSRDLGVYDGMNRGAELASGRWLQFLNAGDSFYRPYSLSAVLRHLECLPSSAIWTVGGAVHVDPISGHERRIANQPHRWLLHALGIQPHCHQASWVRLESHRQLGGFRLDLDFVADHEMLMRLGRQQPPHELREVVIAYQGGGMSEQRVKEIPKALHLNRVRSLGFGAIRESLDDCLTIVLDGYARSRRALGRWLGR